MDENIDPFLLLTTFEPGEWPNIPRPLLLLVMCMQKCISQSHDRVEQVGTLCLQAAEENRKKIRELDQQFPPIKSSISSLDAVLTDKIENTKFKASEDLNLYKLSQSKDLDFKQKSTDTRLNSIQEQVFALKKVVNTLPFKQEIENMIKESGTDLKKSLKKDIVTYCINPEISTLNSKIMQNKEYFETYITRLQEMMEVYGTSIKVLNDQFNEKFVSFERFLNGCDRDFREIAMSTENLVLRQGKEIKELADELENKHGSSKSLFVKIEAKISGFESKMKENFGEIRNVKKKQEVLGVECGKIAEAVYLIRSENANNLVLKNKRREVKEAERKKKEELAADEEVAQNLEIESEKIDESIEKPKIIPQVQPLIPIQLPPIETIDTKPSSNNSVKQKSLIKIISPPPVPEISIADSTESQTPLTKVQNLDLKSNLLTNSFFSNAAVSYRDAISEESPQILMQIKEIETKLSESNELFAKFQNKIQMENMETGLSLKQINEKLQWFPMSLAEIKGKSPNDARLYTLEARLRMEENTRVEQFNVLLNKINHFKFQYFCQESSTLPVNYGKNSARYTDRRTSRESLQSFENGKKPTDFRFKIDIHPTHPKSSIRKHSIDSSYQATFLKVPTIHSTS